MAIYNHQRTYNFFPRIGAPGRIVDLAPYAIDAFINMEETGVMGLGLGVVLGANPDQILLPTSTSEMFVGITVNGGTEEHGMSAEGYIRHTKPLGVMRYGRIYAQIADTNESIINKPVYLIVTGANAGAFTDKSSGNVAVKGRFLSEGSNGIAVVELFNQAQA